MTTHYATGTEVWVRGPHGLRRATVMHWDAECRVYAVMGEAEGGTWHDAADPTDVLGLVSYVTVVILSIRPDGDRIPAGMYEDRPEVYVLTGKYQNEAAAFEAVARRKTAESCQDHAEHSVADAENGPGDDDIPMSWSVELLEEFYTMTVHPTAVIP
jgi:hypothetical protein